MSRNRRYPPEVRERAVALVLEHQGEHRSQRAAMVAHFLWQRPRLDEGAVRAAEAEALGAASGELEQMWAGLTRPQRQVLGAVAEDRAQLLSKPSLAAMGLGKSTAQQARNTLEAEGHLRREDHDLVITDPFVTRWLRR